jgi:hypothetical protein
MKKVTFISAIVIAMFLVSCTADNDETAYTQQEQVKQFDSFDGFSREGDTTSEGEPVKTNGKD